MFKKPSPVGQQLLEDVEQELNEAKKKRSESSRVKKILGCIKVRRAFTFTCCFCSVTCVTLSNSVNSKLRFVLICRNLGMALRKMTGTQLANTGSSIKVNACLNSVHFERSCEHMKFTLSSYV